MTASAKEVIARSLCVADGNDPDGDFRECGPVFLTVAVDHPERWRTRIREADAILAALDAAGYVVAPREPTEAMREAARAAPLARGIGYVGVGEVYRAMIAAQEKQG